MLQGMLRTVEPEQMKLLHESTLKVLEQTGMQIRGRFLLEALADAGCRVDFEQHRAWFKPDVVERQIAPLRNRYKYVRSSLWWPFCKDIPEYDVAWPDEFVIDYGYGTPSLYDYQQGCYRTPTEDDQVQAIKLGNALDCVKAINIPYICGQYDPRVETIESARTLLMNTTKPGWVGVSCAAEVKYLADMARLALETYPGIGDMERQPPIFVHAYCTTSPLKLDNRSCEVLEEALKYRFPVNFAPMPILGATTPMTPAGSAVVAAAEILGCLTAVTLVQPDINCYATSISGEMDMRSTQVCYCTPAAILTDALLHQWFRYQYGIVLNVEPGYVEAKLPGIQASFMKAYRQMAFASTVSGPLPIGALDNASCFSPTQAMIDLDVSQALFKFGRGVEVTPESINIDLINELGFCAKETYLESEHTLEYYRQIGWDTTVFDRSYRSGESGLGQTDDDLLAAADQRWRELVDSQDDIEVSREFAKTLDDIVAAARRDLLSSAG